MSNPRRALVHVLHRLGVAGPARVRACKGSGAPCRARITLTLAAIVVVALTFPVAPASAAAPEKPEATGASAITATTATLEGVLNPGAPGLPGSFQFSYAPSETLECAGASVAPLPPAFANGLEKEAVSTPVSELQPNREYAFCLTAFSLSAESSEPSAAVAFKTPPAPPSVDAESASGVTATAATLEAQVNANNEETTYSFEYSTKQKAGKLEGAIVKVEGAGPLEGFGDQTASVPTGTLLPDTTYFYRVVATNAAGTTNGAVSATGFTTVATPKTEAVTAATSTTATFHGTLTPLNATVESEYVFDYNIGAACAGGGETPVAGAGTGSGPKAVESAVTGLQPGSEYAVCLVSKNAFGSEVDPAPPQTFKTLAGPPSIVSESSSAITPEGATLEAQVNPNNQASTCSFEYSSVEATVTAGKGIVVPCSQPLGSGGAPVTGTATLTGLNLKTTYYYRALAKNASGTTTDPTISSFETETTTAPSLESEAATDITPFTATLNAKVNPNGAQITACKFEYGSTGMGEYDHAVPCAHPDAAELGAGHTPLPVSAALTELKPNITYHWRLTVTSAAGTTTSIDHTFVEDTQVGSPPGSCPSEQVRKEARSTNLPDCRAYEMVTPPNKDGALINSLFAEDSNWGPLIAGNGMDIMAPSIQCLPNTESCTGVRRVEGEPYEFARPPGQGWVTHPLAPPATQFGITSQLGANADMHTTLFSAASSPQGPDDFYLRKEKDAPVKIGPVSETFAGFFGLELGGIPIEATSDFSHMLFIGAGLWSLDGHPETPGSSIYEYAEQGKTKPLSVGVSGPFESTSLVSECGTSIGGFSARQANAYGSFSEDGHIVYFTAEGHSEVSRCPTATPAPARNGLYARIDGEGSDAHTVLISGPTASSCKSAECQAAQSEPQNAEFEGASRDGSRVFFTSAQQLSDDASQGEGFEGRAGSFCHSAGGSGCNLYESVCAEPCGSPGEERELIDVSAGAQKTGGPRVQGVMALSSDGSHVYFVARGVLTKTPNAQGQEAKDELNNLYVYATGQPLRFIATLPQSDENIFKANQRSNEWDNGIELANVTPDGRFLVFVSHAALTPDDTRPDTEAGPTPPTQIYRYDAQTGAIVRISIGQHGFNDNGNAGSAAAESAILFAARGWNYPIGPGRGDPTMSDDGQYVFFESPVALAPGALDEVKVEGNPFRAYAENVYEYHDGNVSLISDGKDVNPNSSASGIETPTRFAGTDSTGKNVFFATNDQLTSQDTDTQRDYYDARICEQADPCVAPPPSPAPGCSEEGCRGASPGAPGTQTPGSQSFNGPGNLTPPSPAVVKPKPLTRAQKLAKALKACRTKHNRHKRSVCEKQARKAYGAHKAGRSGASRRASNDRRGKS